MKNIFSLFVIGILLICCVSCEQPSSEGIKKQELEVMTETYLDESEQNSEASIPKKGQTQPLQSISGKFKLEMPIRKSEDNRQNPVWTPVIMNEKGEVVYEDTASDLSGYHNSYWEWSKVPQNENDNLWIYNSDNGEVWIYYQSYGKWGKVLFDKEKAKLNPPAIIHEQIYRK